MTLTRFQKITLGIAGFTAIAIGAFILTAPHAFYASYGVKLGSDPTMLSEHRASGAAITTLGITMLAGTFRSAWASISIVAAFIVFLAFPLGRVVSIAIDGVPSGGILGALAIEIAIAGLCILAFGRRSEGEMNRGIMPGQRS